MRDPSKLVKREKDIASIYTLYVDDLFTYGCYLGFAREIVKDAIHDIFIKITTDSNKLDNISNIKFYLFRSLKNRLLDIHKNQREHIDLENIDLLQEIPFNIQVNIEDLMIEEEEQMQIKTGIEQMLNSLTDRQREIIYLRYVQGYDYPQIAELLQISVHGCRKLVSKAILSLREKFGIFFLLGYHSYFLLTLK
ncbi:RNA polymerase sigma factor, sigma-70 family [Proteiniphilum saccharofermentans]|uniref:RNA polymerase sigma factor, sigma-70 family n=1 Tax=Proteiniphilum saccharofermentans TaxID=1642647 RepID=A0A1R3SZS3_9BACT|nr:sigma-70 family RNA polymerase sigma factor [Proteiniphilum saccharofermentans]SCD19302.1 RNA polymerase sigma factor, sigma-70 family [Proteiniphilum saccharofermentans]SEA06795.1 RNA polymerase sigma factor, sigma-70 family [Porphyromonadaceae bacterium KH3R12]SFS29726.1 RNA polymerase sigma factor, sigma-70 family [Porphyromonadaceae bacterium NLAE-zl-C104]